MKPKCPKCGSDMTGDDLPVMKARWERIYRTAAAAGKKGLLATDLLARMYHEDEWPSPCGNQVLRVAICDINKILARYNQRIVSSFDGPKKKNTRYRLEIISGK